MALRYLLDENLRGSLWKAIERHNTQTAWWPIDVMRVGDALDLPLGSTDEWILLWAQRENRVLVSLDERTLPAHLAEHLARGHRSPGIFLARAVSLGNLLDFLVCAAHASEPAEWENQITYVP